MKQFEGNRIVFTNLLSYSLDLSLIKQFWYKLKKLIYQAHLEIVSLDSNNDIFQKVFQKALKKAWMLIDIKIIKKLIRCIEKKIKAVIAVKKQYTKYSKSTVKQNLLQNRYIITVQNEKLLRNYVNVSFRLNRRIKYELHTRPQTFDLVL